MRSVEKRKNKGLIAIVVILAVCVIGLVVYILMDHGVFQENKTVEQGEVEENNSSEETEEDNGVAISTDNASIQLLFENAHSLSIGPETLIFRDGGYQVSEMSTEEKMTLVASQWASLVEQYSTGTSPNLTTTYYLEEDTLKDIYERTFGPNTYQAVNQITDGLCTTLTYDASAKRYSDSGPDGCGGTTVFSVHEDIIDAKKYNDRIEIVSAVFYMDPDNLYKDYNKATVLEANSFDPTNTVENQAEREAAYDQYIEAHKDNLEQYTYTYTLNEDGFYYLDSVERTKS